MRLNIHCTLREDEKKPTPRASIKASKILERIKEAMPPRKMIYGSPFTKRQFDKVWKAIESCELSLLNPS